MMYHIQKWPLESCIFKVGLLIPFNLFTIHKVAESKLLLSGGSYQTALVICGLGRKEEGRVRRLFIFIFEDVLPTLNNNRWQWAIGTMEGPLDFLMNLGIKGTWLSDFQ